MKPTLALPIRKVERPSGRWVEAEVRLDLWKDFALLLVSLERELIQEIALRPEEEGKLEVRVSRAAESATGRGTAELSGQRLNVSLSARELSYWSAFFLRAVRDGAADVDHIDVELGGPTPIDLVLIVDSAKPPVPPDEARRILAGRSTRRLR